MALTQRQKNMIAILKKYDMQLKNNNDMYKSYFRPEIPLGVETKVWKHFHVAHKSEQILAFFDTTVFNTCKGGLLFLEDGFYHRLFGTINYAAYKDISSMSIDKGGDLYIYFSSGAAEPLKIYDACFQRTILKCILEELRGLSAFDEGMEQGKKSEGTTDQKTKEEKAVKQLETTEEEFAKQLKAKEEEFAKQLKAKEEEYAKQLKAKEEEYAKQFKIKEEDFAVQLRNLAKDKENLMHQLTQYERHIQLIEEKYGISQREA